MIEWVRNLLTLRPIESINLAQLVLLKIQYFALALIIIIFLWILTYPFSFWRRMFKDKNQTVTQVSDFEWMDRVSYPLFVFLLFLSISWEVFLFRLLPWIFGRLSGSLLLFLLLFHVFWSILHFSLGGTLGVVFRGIVGLLDLRLWLGNLILWGFLVHFLYDLVLFSLRRLHKKIFFKVSGKA